MVLRRVEAAELSSGGSHEAVLAGLVRGELPEHGAREALVDGVLALGTSDRGRVVRDELALGLVVGVRGDGRGVLEDLSAVEGQVLVRPDTLLGGAGADAVVGGTETVGVLEAAAVDGDAEDDLVGGRAGAGVPVECLLGADVVDAVGVDVGLVGDEVEPSTRVFVGLEAG